MTSRELAAGMGGFAIGAMFFLMVILITKPSIPTEQEIQTMERIAPLVPLLQGNCK